VNRHLAAILFYDVVADGNGVFGDGVNIASRLEGVAEAGGICVHQIVRDQLRGKLDLTFQDLGEVKLKNIDVPVRAHYILLDEKAKTVAVTPFENTLSPLRKSRMPRIMAAIVLTNLTLGSALWWHNNAPPVVVAAVERMTYPLPSINSKRHLDWVLIMGTYVALGLAYLRGYQLRWTEPLGISAGVADVIALSYLNETEKHPFSLAKAALPALAEIAEEPLIGRRAQKAILKITGE